MGNGTSAAADLVTSLAWSLDRHDSHLNKQSRILCYGDSLTAGFYAGGQRFSPYGKAMRAALSRLGFQCDVSICGLSGHRADQMVEQLHWPQSSLDICGKTGRGLAHILDNEEPFDLVVLMAGTNDFTPSASLSSIRESVCQLHEACHTRGVPSVMLAAPCNTHHIQVSFSRLLQGWAKRHTEVLAFLDPEEIIPRKHSAYWEPDDVHFSPSGSQVLGARVAVTVAKILEDFGFEANPSTIAQVAPVHVETKLDAPAHLLQAQHKLQRLRTAPLLTMPPAQRSYVHRSRGGA
jgi:lysophospholipase L1-like esterase